MKHRLDALLLYSYFNTEELRTLKGGNLCHYIQEILDTCGDIQDENLFNIYATEGITCSSYLFKGHFIIWDPGINFLGLFCLRHRMISEDVCVYYVVRTST